MGATESFGAEISPLRVFGEELRHYRTSAELSQQELGARVCYSGDVISKIEIGHRPPTKEFVAACDAVQELATNGALTRLRGLLKPYLKQHAYPAWFVGWAAKEAHARVLRSFEPLVVPGLLQTEAYARALLANRIAAIDDTEEIVAARMERQAILAREQPPELWVLIDEAVLHRPVGGAAVMREQVGELVKAARRPNIIIQVVPAAMAVHEGLRGAGFVIAHFDDAPPAAYLDTAIRGLVIEDGDDINALMATWDKLRQRRCRAALRST
jgi:transcriptional regulator with XRE-family HTH domain